MADRESTRLIPPEPPEPAGTCRAILTSVPAVSMRGTGTTSEPHDSNDPAYCCPCDSALRRGTGD
jgi:hypothetical protein